MGSIADVRGDWSTPLSDIVWRDCRLPLRAANIEVGCLLTASVEWLRTGTPPDEARETAGHARLEVAGTVLPQVDDAMGVVLSL
mmetsp:Transcript_48044/g.112246  ORF Transcript_48044/g.112246 Transcript_48044/m.112246 type:complete len:84 (+) Transcript_48044:2461-2712(+)